MKSATLLVLTVSTLLLRPCLPLSAQAPPALDAALRAEDRDPRRPLDDDDLQYWLRNMVWHHNFSLPEIEQATGLAAPEISAALRRFGISRETRLPHDAKAPLLVVPYPGGRHPRIGFLDGAVRPQRETKISVFTPWDPDSYVVLDVPEAIWSNLGLTYLAHTHVPTVWSRQDIELPRQEWRRGDGTLSFGRVLPNGVAFGTTVIPRADHVQMEMWLTNGSGEKLSDLRVQNCVMLKGARGFQQQTNDNKITRDHYVACRSDDGPRWIITAWDPLHRAWSNPPCPCMHSDPQFPDCQPGETQRLRGWLSFYQGDDIQSELDRIEATGWRRRALSSPGSRQTLLVGRIVDSETKQLIPARLHVQGPDGQWRLAASAHPVGSAVSYDKAPANMPGSAEVHTTLSPHPFQLSLPPGEYRVRVERGKEYLPLERKITVAGEAVALELPLQRWINMAERGWYSGDTHVHRSLNELPNVLLAEDLNVALPLTYWVRETGVSPAAAYEDSSPPAAKLIEVDDRHVIYPLNTEYEIFSVGSRRHTLGAVFVLNHRQPLDLATPPVRPIADEARRQGALLDLDKHSWPWSLMLIPVMNVDLFELSNNHLWQTNFGFTQWTLETAPAYMQLEIDERGFTEWGWTDFGWQTYYALLNCGYRLRVTAGTASGVHPVQLGFGRVYVHLPEGFSYEDWMKGLDAGRSFVSTGPMLEVTFNEHRPGHRFELPAGETDFELAVQGLASSRRPLDRIEIVVNGRVAQRLEPENRRAADGGFASPVQAVVGVDATSWLAVRCFERHPTGRVRFAHSNPVHVDVPDRPLRPRPPEVAYLMGRMEEEIARNQDVLDEASLEEYRQALADFRQKLDD